MRQILLVVLVGCATPSATSRHAAPVAPVTRACPVAAETPAPAKSAKDFGLTAYDESAEATLDPSVIAIEPLDDLDWLAPAAKAKVVLFGENHWYHETHALALRVLFALEEQAHVELLTVEQPYSEGAFWDHYVGIIDDAEAATFYREALARRVGTAEQRAMLEAVRAWNLANPDRRIHLRSHDVEHDREAAVEDVIVPYFEGLDAGFALTAADFADDPLGSLDALGPWLARAKKAKHVGAYPFVTAGYVAGVIANLRAVYLGDEQDFTYYRQRAIVRNLTDRAYLGDFLRKHRVMLWGGSYHTQSDEPLPDDGGFLREGAYLAHDFAPTRGKTYAIQVLALASSLGVMKGAELGALQAMGSGLRDRLSRMIEAEQAGAITADGFYFTDEVNPAFAMLAGLAGTVAHQPFRIASIDWAALGPVLEQLGGKRLLHASRRQVASHDALIVIPRSAVLEVLPRL
jgi:hypothetical protein